MTYFYSAFYFYAVTTLFIQILYFEFFKRIYFRLISDYVISFYSKSNDKII